MSEFDYNNKLNTNNPSTIASVISKLCDDIKTKSFERNDSTNSCAVHDLFELKYLKRKCSDDSKLVALTAGQGISALVEQDVLPLRPTVTELVSSLSHARCYSGIIETLCNLLFLDVKRNVKSNYALLSPQHPLITVLLHDYSTWHEIFQRISSYNDGNSAVEVYEQLRPFVFFIMCCPDPNVPVLCQSVVWNYFLQLNASFSYKAALNDVVPWLTTDSALTSFKVEHIVTLADLALELNDSDLLLTLSYSLSCNVYTLLKHYEDPNDCIDCIREIMRTTGTDFPYNYLLFVVAETLYVCPAVHLNKLLDLCVTILEACPSCNAFALMSLKAPLLHWLMYCCSLTQNCKRIVVDLLAKSFDAVTLPRLKTTERMDLLQYSDKLLGVTIRTCDVITFWNGNEAAVVEWLDGLLKLPGRYAATMYSFLSGVFLWNDAGRAVVATSLKVLLHAATYDINLSPYLLTIVLYKLSNESEPHVQAALSNVLPKLTMLPQNLPVVIHTIKSFTNGPPRLKVHSMKLLYDLWLVEPKCYTYLQKMMLCKPSGDANDHAEFYLLKAYILMEICSKRPEVYGTEMVSHLSDVLNRCADARGTLSSSLALRGIASLCKASIIDVPSTWHALAPKLNADDRPDVLVSLCDFFAEVPDFYVSSEMSDALEREVIDKLWQLIGDNSNENVLLAAAHALSNFSVDKVREQAPERYFDSDGHFTSYCWITVTEQLYACPEAAGNLLIGLVRTEIKEFRGCVYHIPEGRKEPMNYNYLPTHSVLRAVGNYVVQQSPKRNVNEYDDTFIQSLRVLSETYSKPLPPLDWCFLHELIHVPAFKRYVLNVAARQILLSGTARRLIDNFILELKPCAENLDDVVFVMSSLKFLCNGIQPTILQPFVKCSLQLGFAQDEMFESGMKMLDCVKDAITDKDVHLANKSGIADMLKEFVEEIDLKHPMFPHLLNCVLHLEDEFIYLINMPTEPGPTEIYNFERTVTIRTEMVVNRCNLICMNDCIDAAVSVEERRYVLKRLIDTLVKQPNPRLFSVWSNELLSKIQAATAADDDSNSATKLTYLCDLYVASIVIVSGYYSLCVPDVYDCEQRMKLFPFAVASLLKVHEFRVRLSEVNTATYDYARTHN